MGLTQSKQSFKQVQFQNLIQIRKLSQSKTLFRCPQTDKLYITLQHTFATNQQLDNFITEFKKKLLFNHIHYLSSIDYFTITASNICSKQHRLVQLYPYQSHTLIQQVQNRMLQKRIFNWKEIWSILCSSVLVMGHFCRNQSLHYTLSPYDIILNSQGNVKVLPMELSDFQFDYSIRKQYYYSPQMLKAMKCTSQVILNNKSGVFTLALTILHLINLKSMSHLYNFQELTINYELLIKYVDLVEDDDIRHILKKMIKQAPYQRITFTQLQEMLYGILERQSSSTEQFQKLQDSIYQLNSQTFNATPALVKQNSIQLKQFPLTNQTLQADNQDINSIGLLIQQDYQKIDEQQTYKLTLNIQHTPSKILTDRSNIDLSKITSVKICDQKSQGILPISQMASKNLQSSNRAYGPYYVTQQYNRGRYQGYKENGMRHGFGTFYYQQGGKYTGQWVKNKMEGRGALYYTCGNIAYEGQWKKDQLHGYGVLYNENPKYTAEPYQWKNMDKIDNYWVKYQGNFEQDLKHGDGTLYLSNGQYYRGNFQNDLPDGDGTFRNTKGNLITGIWKKGVFQEKNYKKKSKEN